MGPETDTDDGLQVGPLGWADEKPPLTSLGGVPVPGAAADPTLPSADVGAAATDAAPGPRTAARPIRRCLVLLADLLDLAADAEALTADLAARDLTIGEAAAVLREECPGVAFGLLESASECEGLGFPPPGRACSANVYPGPGRGGVRAFHGRDWRAVVSDVAAACRAGGPDGGVR